MNCLDDNQEHDPLDEQIDSALSFLSTAVAPDGMKARIIGRARQPHSSVPWFVRGASWSFAAAACCVTIAFGVALVQRNSAIENDEAAHLFTPQFVSVPPATAYPVRGAQKAVPHNIPNASSRPKLIFVGTAESRGVMHKTALPEAQNTAYAEMLAPSKPAPEMPLTDQEKRLLRAAKRQDEHNQVAELRRPVWPLHDPEDDDNFETFFQKPINSENINETNP